MYKILDGKTFSQEIKQNLEHILKKINSDDLPTLGILQVGNLEESNIYIKHKINFADSLGIKCKFIKLQENSSYNEIKNAINELTSKTNGLIVQLPMQTNKLNKLQITNLLNLIPTIKDIDGLSENNLNSEYNENNFLPATATGIVLLLKKYNITLDNTNIGIVGFSNIVGRPLYNFFIHRKNNYVTKYLKETSRENLKNANIIIVATGQKNPIDIKDIKDNVIIVDVGIHRDANNKISGDLDFSSFAKKSSYITPVPGGVGPMTIVALILNLIKAYILQCPQKKALYQDILSLI